jgi:broad specificity phosphatase PhoE
MARDVKSIEFGKDADNSEQAVLYVVRHGETKLNADNFRGFADVPLDDNGRQQAQDAKEFLSDADFVAACSSDLKRAAETLDIILEDRKVTPQRLVSLRPWNIGEFSGEPKNESNRKAVQEYADSPDEIVPDGESLAFFRSRYKNAFDDIIAEGVPALVVQHASNNHELGNILHDDLDALDVEPGGIICVYRSGKGLRAEILAGERTEGRPSYVS